MLLPEERSPLRCRSKTDKKSTFQNLSEYGRAMILGKPVTVIHRDKSMDEVLEELILLRRELAAGLAAKIVLKRMEIIDRCSCIGV